MALRPRTLLIRQFIVQQVEKHKSDIAHHVAQTFDITSQAARNHLSALERDGVLEATGRTRAKSYTLKTIATVRQTYLRDRIEEDLAWLRDFKPHLLGMRNNALSLCGNVFGEMLNNAIDHSESSTIDVEMSYTAAMATFSIRDHGIGIFRKIKESLNLPEERMAIVELSKGKLTTAPNNHSGMGIFFSSRMADLFSIRSGELFFQHIQPEDDWLLEASAPFSGTLVDFTVSTATEKTAADVYNQFCSDPNDEQESHLGFRKTHVPLRLAQYGSEQLVSRSQAKRILARFDRFAEVLLDFEGVEFIGQAFADEIFRVFAAQHPEIKIVPIRTARQIVQMISLAKSVDAPPQKGLFEVD